MKPNRVVTEPQVTRLITSQIIPLCYILKGIYELQRRQSSANMPAAIFFVSFTGCGLFQCPCLNFP
jgi:hypothetical protein